jgi:hypothetical protein
LTRGVSPQRRSICIWLCPPAIAFARRPSSMGFNSASRVVERMNSLGERGEPWKHSRAALSPRLSSIAGWKVPT